MSDLERRLSGDDSTATKYGSTTQQRQKLDYLLGLGVLTVEMSFDERKAQPWIFFGVDRDEDGVGLVFWISALRED